MLNEALVGLIFVPLLAACFAMLPGAWTTRVAVVFGLLAPPVLLVPVTTEIVEHGATFYALGGYAAPLGIRLLADPLAVVMLWLVAVIGGLSGLHACFEFPPGSSRGERFWPLWLLLTSAMNALFLSADLFNLYVCLELITLAAIPLIAIAGTPDALRAAMRYLLLALLASLVYLLGVALIYNATGTLDIYLAAELSADPIVLRAALGPISAGLLLKGAVFPLHVWLPRAHASAPGAVSAVLSALVVKTAIYLLYRVWFWMAPATDAAGAAADIGTASGILLGLLGAGALIYGGIAALIQDRLKLIIAYSTVAQLGYLMLLFPLAASVSGRATAWEGALYQLITHGLAKAAMFLAAANILHALGTDRLRGLDMLDRRMPVALFALALASVSIMGLPPSGGFLAKWLLLEAAWRAGFWPLPAILVLGSLLAAAYVFRILGATLRRKDPTERAGGASGADLRVHPLQTASAMILALLALAAGFGAAPILALVTAGAPAGWISP